MTDEWKQKTIGELCEKVTSGGTPFRGNASYYINGIIPWIKTGELHDGKIYETDIEERITEDALNNSSAKLFPKDTILMAMYGDGKTIGSLGIIQQPSTSNQACSALIANSEICLPKFLFYSLIVWRDGLIRLAYGGAQRNLTSKLIQQYEIPVPPLHIQKKIATILSAYDDLIKNNLKQIRLLEEMAQITYQEWFVRLQFPNHENIPIDEITGLPIGWRLVEFGKYIKFHKGKKLDDFFYKPFIGSEKIILLDSLESGVYKYTNPNGHIKTSRGDLVMLMDGARSSCVFYTEKGVVGSTLSKIESTEITISFLYQLFLNNMDILQTNNTGSAIPHANKSFINSMKIVLPDKDILKQWSDKVSLINKQVWILKDQNQCLKEARDILLPRLMTGKITVE